jgi:hypothetical protein
MTTRARLAPKPVRLWALVDRLTHTPRIMWYVLAHRRKDIEYHYMVWMCGMNDPKGSEYREKFRADLASGRYTIERVTLTPEARDG